MAKAVEGLVLLAAAAAGQGRLVHTLSGRSLFHSVTLIFASDLMLTHLLSSTQNTGGRTISGSGPAPAYGGRYAGGAAVPYTAGARSPTRGVLPYALPIAAIGFFPGLWLYGSLWAYPYGSPYYYNHNGRNTTANVTCLCQQYSECGCDDTGNSTLVQSIVNNGTDQPVNSTVSQFVTWPNGTSDAYINGTLPNGTTAPGGTDPSNTDEIPSGAARLMMNLGGYWIMVVTVGATVMAL